MPVLIDTEIKINDLIISNNDFSYLSIQENLNAHHLVILSCPISNLSRMGFEMTDVNNYIGKDVEISIGYGFTPEYKYKGVVKSLHLERASVNTGEEITFHIASPTILLDDHEICKSFSDKTVKDIIEDLVSSYPVDSKINPIFKDKIDYAVQYRETPYQYISRLAGRYSEWFYYDGLNIVFGNKEDGGTVDLLQGDSMSSYSLDVMSVPLKDHIIAHDYLKDEDYSSEMQYDQLSNLDIYGKGAKEASLAMYKNKGNDLYNPKFKNKKGIEKQLELFKVGLQSQMVKFSAHTKELNIHVGTTIKVSGVNQIIPGKTNISIPYKIGNFTVIDVNHQISSTGIYNNSITAIPTDVIHPPTSLTNTSYAENQTAKVIDNDDSEKIGRVKVRFPWMQDGESTPFIRVATSLASGDRGFYFTPEIGDEVLVDFEGGDPECPIVIASLFNGQSKPAKWNDSSNNIMAIKTKSGNEICFNDKGGNETIDIFNSNKQNIISLSLDGTHIDIKSDGNINIIAKDNITMKATNIELNASDDIKQSAGKKMKLSSTDYTNDNTTINTTARKEIKISCNTLGVSTKSKFEIENAGTDECSIKGAASKLTIETLNFEQKSTINTEISALNKVALSSKVKMELESRTMEITGKKEATLTAKTTTVNGDLKLDVKGKKLTVEGTKVAVKGSMLDVKGSAIVNVKGAIVKIN